MNLHPFYEVARNAQSKIAEGWTTYVEIQPALIAGKNRRCPTATFSTKRANAKSAARSPTSNATAAISWLRSTEARNARRARTGNE